MTDDKKIISVKEMRQEFFKLHRKFFGKKGRTKLEHAYLTKLRYMAWFFAVHTSCKKKIVDNWILPDARTLKKLENEEGMI